MQRRAVHMAERNGGIDQPTVEEDRSGSGLRRLEIIAGLGQRAAGEGREIDPGQGVAAAGKLLGNDAAAGLRDDTVATLREGLKKRRLAAAGAAGDQNETGHETAFIPEW